jgi:hypothetical protein
LHTSIEEADYAVLSKKHSSYVGLVSQAEDAGTIPISPQFIEDCVQQAKFLDTDGYVWNFDKKGRNLSEPSTSKFKVKVKVENAAQNDELVQNSPARANKSAYLASMQRKAPSRTARRRSTGALKQKAQAPASFSSSEDERTSELHAPKKRKSEPLVTSIISLDYASPMLGRSHSPTPPPASSRVSQAGGKKFMYTEEEEEYAKRYIAYLIEQDPEIPKQNIADGLYRKACHQFWPFSFGLTNDQMNHHTLRSWAQHIHSNFGDLITEHRKRAEIANRKKLRLQKVSERAESPPEQATREPSPSHPHKQIISPPPTPITPSFIHDTSQLEDEIDIIVRFFQEEVREDPDAEEIWSKLESQVCPRTHCYNTLTCFIGSM